MLGVWQGIPYLFADFIHEWHDSDTEKVIDSRAAAYRWYLLYLAIPPMLLLWFGKPVWIVLLYSVAGAAFMPLLAGLLLHMNGVRHWLGKYRNGWPSNLALLAALILFASLMARKISASI